ncbi:hypothetical protein C8J57DRAFT_1527532 [Mycena rebaudengoi]|nr:hypothetical protein C8J57DRAFT_1527532 [Mycena rebaudengoi]
MDVDYSRAHPDDPLRTVDYREIHIYHPGYEPKRLILILCACPCNPNVEPVDDDSFGLPRDLVRLACSILAGNKTGGLYRLTKSSRKPSVKTFSDSTEVITPMISPGDYAYCLDGTPLDYKYPLVRAFSDWKPQIPLSWMKNRATKEYDIKGTIAASAVSDRVKSEDVVCILTRDKYRLDSAHLVPRSATKWFNHHQFYSDAGDYRNPTVDSPNNRLVMRTDISGRCFDEEDCCFYPYRENWVVLWLGPNSLELARKYNFCILDLPSRLRGAYLCARFAWTIFRLSKNIFDGLPNDMFSPGAGLDDSDYDSPGGDAGGPGLRRQPHRNTRDKKSKRGAGPAERPFKKRRLHTDADNTPDLWTLTPRVLQKMKAIDHRLQAGVLPYDGHPEWYPGFSEKAEMAYRYKLDNPTATDPGGARIGTLLDRDE